MCGHGMIGLAVTLAHLGRIQPGEHAIETPVGTVRIHCTKAPRHHPQCSGVSPSCGVTVHMPGYGTVTGDVAWGGNWFFLVGDHSFSLGIENVETLTAFTWEIRRALAAAGITGVNGAEIDHIELFTKHMTLRTVAAILFSAPASV